MSKKKNIINNKKLNRHEKLIKWLDVKRNKKLKLNWTLKVTSSFFSD